MRIYNNIIELSVYEDKEGAKNTKKYAIYVTFIENYKKYKKLTITKDHIYNSMGTIKDDNEKHFRFLYTTYEKIM